MGKGSRSCACIRETVTGLDWLIVAFALAMGLLGLPAGADRRRTQPGRLRDRRLPRQPARARAAARGLPFAVRARDGTRRGAPDRRDRRRLAGGRSRSGAPAAPRRRRAGDGALAIAESSGGAALLVALALGARLALRRRGAQRPGREGPAEGGSALGDPAGAQQRLPAVELADQRPEPDRPAGRGRRGRAPTSLRPTRRSPRTPTCGRRRNSVVRVLGTACGLGVEGSGWIAAPGLVVTNAHVVAGETDTTVTPAGSTIRSTRRPCTTTRRTTSRCSASTGSAGPRSRSPPRCEAGHGRGGPRLPGERPVHDRAGPRWGHRARW